MSSNVTEHMDEHVYLSPDVKIEPLVLGWYAWPQLISPATLALNIAYKLLPLMKSFVSNPAVHIAANADPKLFGGPFMSLQQEDVPKIASQIEDIDSRCRGLIEFAQAFRDMDARLQENASGFSLNEFYLKLPGALKGLVELQYDINNKPGIRIFEPLLYRAGLSSQLQEISLSCVADRDRKFFMSTPRLPSADEAIFNMRFSDGRLDALSEMRHTPGSFREVADLLSVREDQRLKFRKFFTTTKPKITGARDYDGEGVRVRYFGHACVLIQTAEVAILIDPVLAFEPGDDDRLTFNDLPDVIDYVIISHSHQDHFCAEMLIQLRHRVRRIVVPHNNSGNVADPSMKLVLMELGYKDIMVLDPFDTFDIPQGSVECLPFTGENADLDIYSKQTLLITIKDRRILLLVDSDGQDATLYERMLRDIPVIDMVFLGMECHGAPLNWLYEPLLTKPLSRKNNESRRLSGANCERAWNIIQKINCPEIFVYAMGQEPWLRYLMGLEYAADSIQLKESDEFIRRCSQAGLRAERLFLSREIQL